MTEFQKAAKLADIHEGKITLARLNGEEIALFNLGGEIFATTNICTHEHCELDQNNYIEGEVVECTCHGSQFKIKTGENVQPPAAEPLRTYKTKIEGEDVLVEI